MTIEPLLPLDHDGKGRSHVMKRAFHVDRHQVIPFRFRRLQDVLGEDDGCVVHEDVDRTEALERTSHSFVGGGFCPDISA